LRALGPDLSVTGEADVTVVEVAAIDVNKILQVNLHNSKTASAALLLCLTEGGADLVLVGLSWTTPLATVPIDRSPFWLVILVILQA